MTKSHQLQSSCRALRQPTQRITITLRIPENINFSHLDDWLENALAIKAAAVCNQGEDSEIEAVSGFLKRCLLLNSVLLQLANIPVFDAGYVQKIARKKTERALWKVELSVVCIENLPTAYVSTALEQAIKILFWCIDAPRTQENRDQLYRTLEKVTKPLLRKNIVAGKSTIPVLRVAHRINIPFLHLGAGVYQLGWGVHSRKMDRSTTDSDSAIGSKLSNNKIWSAGLIRMAGLPAPEHDVVTSVNDAIQSARRIGWPVVVKPSDRERGEGITVGIRDDEQLTLAFDEASKLSKSKQIIIEREVCGVCHRLFIFAGQLLYAVKRLPKSVRGNGQQTVGELIAEANRLEADSPPWLKSEPFPVDDLAVKAMNAAGFSLQSIPENGVWVPLRMIESTESGGHDEDFTELVHPDNLDIALRAAKLFGLEVVGVDIISPDIQLPWHQNGAIINEVNFAPLFGGAEISRSYIPTFFRRLLVADGRIPVEVFVGSSKAISVAKQRQQEQLASGTQCFLTSHQLTLDPSGHEMTFPFQALSKRCQALLLDRRVEAIILVIQTDELLHVAMPVDRINKLTSTGESLATTSDYEIMNSRERLIAHLQDYVW